MIKKSLYVLFLLTTMPTASCANNTLEDTEKKFASASVVELLTQPDEFVNKEVMVIGYLGDTIQVSLFLTEDHAKIVDLESSIAVFDQTDNAALYSSTCLNNYVRLIAELERDKEFGYALTKVRFVQILQGGSVCYEVSTAEPQAEH